MAPLSLYIHVPFCLQRCAYCHFDIKVFHPRTNPQPWIDRYLAAIRKELVWNAERWPERELATLFLGGGTPSRLKPEEIRQLIQAVAQTFSLSKDLEISMEANPEDASLDAMRHWQDAGINRLSFGVQTFFDPSLQAIKRAHTGQGALLALQGRPAFSKGVSMDLMLGLPYQTQASLIEDLRLVEALAVDHVSVYMLERDLPTPLDALSRKMPLPDEDLQADYYEWVSQYLGKVGYQKYEISNFAKPGFTCRHNLVYWNCGDYLGVGPAAHGRVGLEYWGNDPSLSSYIQKVEKQGHGRTITTLWDAERLAQERLIQGFRLTQGVERIDIPEGIWEKLEPVRAAGLLKQVGSRIALTEKGCLLANEVLEHLIPSSEAPTPQLGSK